MKRFTYDNEKKIVKLYFMDKLVSEWDEEKEDRYNHVIEQNLDISKQDGMNTEADMECRREFLEDFFKQRGDLKLIEEQKRDGYGYIISEKGENHLNVGQFDQKILLEVVNKKKNICKMEIDEKQMVKLVSWYINSNLYKCTESESGKLMYGKKELINTRDGKFFGLKNHLTNEELEIIFEWYMSNYYEQ